MLLKESAYLFRLPKKMDPEKRFYLERTEISQMQKRWKKRADGNNEYWKTIVWTHYPRTAEFN